MVSALYRSTKYLTTPAIVYISKSQIRPSAAAVYGQELPSFQFQDSMESENMSVNLWVMRYFSPSNAFPPIEMFRVFRTLSLFSWKVFRRSTFLSSTRPNLNG